MEKVIDKKYVDALKELSEISDDRKEHKVQLGNGKIACVIFYGVSDLKIENLELKEAYLAIEKDRKEMNKDWDKIIGEQWN